MLNIVNHQGNANQNHNESGNSLVVQWLGLSAFIAMAWVQSLFGELRSHKLHAAAKKKEIHNEISPHTCQNDYHQKEHK